MEENENDVYITLFCFLNLFFRTIVSDSLADEHGNDRYSVESGQLRFTITIYIRP